MQEGGFQYKNIDNADGEERRYNRSNGSYPAEAVNSPLMASGISTAASTSMSSCASNKRGMDQVSKLQRITVEVVERFL